MTREENIRAILECNFAGFKDDIIDIAVKRISEIEQRPTFIAKSDGTIEQIKKCEDCISRQDVLTPYKGLKDNDVISVWLIRKNIEQQPSVIPYEPKAAHWIVYPKDIYANLVCDNCLSRAPYDCKTNFCPTCGRRMVR